MLYDPQMKELIIMRNDSVPPRNEKIWKRVFIFFPRCIFQSLLKAMQTGWRLNNRARTYVRRAWAHAINQITTLNQTLQESVQMLPLLMAFHSQFFGTTLQEAIWVLPLPPGITGLDVNDLTAQSPMTRPISQVSLCTWSQRRMGWGCPRLSIMHTHYWTVLNSQLSVDKLH